MPIDTTLLDLDRIPTLDELKAFFKKHDWSAAKISEPSSRDAEKAAEIKEIKKYIDVEFEKIAREKGLGAPSKYFNNKISVKGEGGNVFENQGNPLMALRDGTEDLVADAVYEIGVNHENIFDAVFSRFDFSDPDFHKKADEFLHNAVGTMLDVMEYEKLVNLIHETSAFEDFNQSVKPNYRAEDHERGWYHLDTKHPTLPDPDVEQHIRNQYPRTEDIAIANVTVEEYWKTLDEKDRIILKMLMDGYTQNEAAKAVGMANNGGVSKRLARIRGDFIRKTGVKIE